MNSEQLSLRNEVRERYAAAALAVSASASDRAASCCGDDCGVGSGCGCGSLYDADQLAQLPSAAIDASLGCGNPTAVAQLNVGETVLDLGSGGGIDVILSARRVGPTGKAYGLDMTDEMLALARRNAAAAAVTNAEFLRGEIENVPLPDESIDVVISNCVVNLSTDKHAVFAEMHRVLRRGGRLGISDIVAEDHLSPAQRAERGDFAGCIAGALSRAEYLENLATTGFAAAEVTFTRPVADGLHSAVIRAVKP